MDDQTLTLPREEVHLWYFQTDRQPVLPLTEAIDYLDETEQRQYERYLCSQKRIQFLNARVLLKKMLSRYLAKPAKMISFHYSQEQKPFLERSLAFNLSHSGRHIIMAMARHSVGVDIQEESDITKDHVFQGLSAEEQQKVSRESLWAYWVLKEAMWKADNHKKNADVEHLLNSSAFCQPETNSSFSVLLDSSSMNYLKLSQNLHLGWVINYPQPICRLNGLLLNLS